MELDPRISQIVSVVENQVARGAHWGSGAHEIATVAVKRWTTYIRRHPKAKRISDHDRAVDLTKGFEAHFESGEKPWNIPPGEWMWLAETILPILHLNES